MSQKYTPGELILFLDGPRLIDGSDLNHNFELLFYPDSSTRHVTSAQSPYTVLETDQTILVDATAGNVTILIPDARFFLRPQLNIKKTDSGVSTVTVKPILGDTIDGAYNNTYPYVLTQPEQAIILVSDYVSNWPIVATYNFPISPVFGNNVTITHSSSPYTMLAANGFILCDTSAGDITINAVQAAAYGFDAFTVFNIGLGEVTIIPHAGDSIAGTAILAFQNQSITYHPYGTSWYCV